MHLDGRELPDGARLQADVAIVGAGPAGIAMALELGRAGHDVVLLESGQHATSHQTQALGDLAAPDEHHVAMDLATSRQVGGASNLWGGRCVPYDRLDFEAREGIDARWPVGYEELLPHFQAACDWFRCGDAVFDAKEVPGLAELELVPGLPEGDVRTTSLERWSLPTNFRSEYAADLRRSPSVRLVTGLTCVEIVTDADADRVARLRTRTASGREVTVHAQLHVLACGGLETTRLLLASDRHRPGGLGNHAGHLGRWYMAHVESRIARVHLAAEGPEPIYGHERDQDGVYVRRRFSFSAELQRRHRLPNSVLWFANPELADPSHRSGILSFVYLALVSPFGRHFVSEGIRQAHIAPSARFSWREHALNVSRELGPAVSFALRFAYERYLRPGRKVPGFFVRSAARTYPLVYHGEHRPLADSRVVLSEDSDAFGLRRIRTDLRFGDADVHDVVRAHELLDGHLRAHGRGWIEYFDADPESAVRDQLFGGYHQTGTTRASATPEEGVVDRDLAIHGFEDLFVASSSTFPTSSQANSTFMLVVFALRLVEHLSEQLRTASSRATGDPSARR